MDVVTKVILWDWYEGGGGGSVWGGGADLHVKGVMMSVAALRIMSFA